MRYEGKEPCQGCGKPGSEMSRAKKDSLCSICRKMLERGKAVTNMEEIDESYIQIFQHHHAFHGDETNRLCHEILSIFHNGNIQNAPYWDHNRTLKEAWGSNGKHYTIPKKLFEPLKTFFANLEKTFDQIGEKEKAIPENARKAVAKEKNKIFNEGVQKGRDLLVALNAGKITLAEFEKDIQKY